MIQRKAIFIPVIALAMTVTAPAFYLVDSNRTGAQSPYSAEDYADETMSRLLGEEEYARFEHNHPPITCTELPFCSELYFHRFEIGGLIKPEFKGVGNPASELEAMPTPTPQQLAPGQVDLSQIKEQVVRDLFDDEGFLIDPNERAGRISESHPGGYGGYYFSEDDRTVYVYMLDPTQQEAAEAAVRAAHGAPLDGVENIVPVQGQFSMRQLVDWYRPLKRMLNERGVHPSISGIYEIHNRIELGFRDFEEKRATIESVIAELEIPADAVHLEENYITLW